MDHDNTTLDHSVNQVQIVQRFTVAIRFLAVAHCMMLISWWMSGNDLLLPKGPFTANHPSSMIWTILWAIGSVALLSLGQRFIWTSSLLTIIGLVGTLSPLPAELSLTSDRLLVSLTFLAPIFVLAPGKSLKRWGFVAYCAIWSWSSIAGIFGGEDRLWLWGRALNFWGWTSSSPTPFALILGSLSSDIRHAVGILLMALLTWGPMLLLLKIRLWPLLWGGCLPLAIWAGGGAPTWLGSGLFLIGALCLDERWLLGSRLKEFTRSRYFDHKLSIILPMICVTLWLALATTELLTPLILIAAWLMWVAIEEEPSHELCSYDDAETEDPHIQKPSNSVGKWGSYLLLLCLCCGLMAASPLRVTQYLKQIDKDMGNMIDSWSITKADQTWLKLPIKRSSLIVEMSEDGGASYQTATPQIFSEVSLTQQPWFTVDLKRSAHWFHQLASSGECMEGPLMELTEQLLTERIKTLNTPPLKINPDLILLRIRLVEWSRSSYQFWREEGRGFFCIETNLKVLKIARQRIQKSRKELPRMPELHPSH